MPFEAQLIEAARLVRERETRHALVHLAAVREAGRIHRRARLARLSGRITRSLRLRARPVPTGSAISHASVALDWAPDGAVTWRRQDQIALDIRPSQAHDRDGPTSSHRLPKDATASIRRYGANRAAPAGRAVRPSTTAEETVEALGGTRHTSGRRFSRDDPLAIVIAASEDGPISVLRNRDVLGRSPNDAMMQ